MAEINGYKSFYSEGTELPNNKKIDNNNIEAGIIDYNSTPGNLLREDVFEKNTEDSSDAEKPEVFKANFEKNFEDDTDRARGLQILIYNNFRGLNGYVWEDKRNHEVKGAMIGNGVREEKEIGVNGVTVQLVERIPKRDGDGNVIYSGKEFIWAEATSGIKSIRKEEEEKKVMERYGDFEDFKDGYVVNEGNLPSAQRLVVLPANEIDQPINSDKISRIRTNESTNDISVPEYQSNVLNGYFNFVDFIPGDYIIRFKYGDKSTVVELGTKIEQKLEEKTTEENIVSYNGQDFKSTIYQKDIKDENGKEIEEIEIIEEINKEKYYYYYYNIAKADEYAYNLSDAKDLWNTEIKWRYINENPSSEVNLQEVNLQEVNLQGRKDVRDYSKTVDTYEKAEILAAPYHKDDTDIDIWKTRMNELINNTNMTAETAIIKVETEYNRTQSEGEDNANEIIENGNYIFFNIDFGLVERPKAQLELNKEVTDAKISLTTNQTPLFHGYINEEDELKSGEFNSWQRSSVVGKSDNKYNLDNYKIGENELKYNDYYEDYKHRYAYREIVNILVNETFNQDQKNNGIIKAEMDKEILQGSTIELTYTIKVKNVGEVDYYEEPFYYKGNVSNEENMVKTEANLIVDYPKNLHYVKEYEQNEDNQWKAVIDELINENDVWDKLVEDKLLEKDENNNYISGYIQIDLKDELKKCNLILTTDKLDEIGLKPGETTKCILVLQKSLSEDSCMVYNNIAEIIKISNTVGRRMSYSIQGNQNPNEEAQEVDSANAQEVQVGEPTGAKHTYYTLGIVIVAIIIIGVIFIKKTVFRNNDK